MAGRIVVTGLAIWSPFGRGLDRFWQALISGESGRKSITRFDAGDPAYRTDMGATIDEIGGEDEDAEATATAIMRTVLDDLLEDARISPNDESLEGAGVCLGSSQSTIRPLREFVRARKDGESGALAPGSTTVLTAASAAVDLANRAGAGGPAAIVSTACASSTSSIGIGADWIRQGRATSAIVGGIGYFTEITQSGFNILRLLGRDGCKPFAADRDGIMLGDGYALAYLEDEESAARRGATVRAKIVGFSSRNEAYHSTSPSPDGGTAFTVMWEALHRSPELLAAVDYINAHGTGTKVNDAAEMSAIGRLCEMRGGPIPVSSTKGHHGHALGAAGGIEFVATVLAIEHGVLPPTIGVQDLDPTFAGADVVTKSRPQPIRIALSNSFAFGGNCAAIAIAAPSFDLP